MKCLRFSSLPRGSYPTPFLGRLLFKTADPNHRTRYPKKGIGYEPLGRATDLTTSAGSAEPLQTSKRATLFRVGAHRTNRPVQTLSFNNRAQKSLNFLR